MHPRGHPPYTPRSYPRRRPCLESGRRVLWPVLENDSFSLRLPRGLATAAVKRPVAQASHAAQRVLCRRYGFLDAHVMPHDPTSVQAVVLKVRARLLGHSTPASPVRVNQAHGWPGARSAPAPVCCSLHLLSSTPLIPCLAPGVRRPAHHGARLHQRVPRRHGPARRQRLAAAGVSAAPRRVTHARLMHNAQFKPHPHIVVGAAGCAPSWGRRSRPTISCGRRRTSSTLALCPRSSASSTSTAWPSSGTTRAAHRHCRSRARAGAGHDEVAVCGHWAQVGVPQHAERGRGGATAGHRSHHRARLLQRDDDERA